MKRLAALVVSIAISLVALELAARVMAEHPSLRDIATDQNGRTVRFVPNDVLGYAPEPNTTIHWRRTIGDLEIFDLTYQINALGFRQTPITFSSTCVLAFGDSFTFGAGLSDDDHWPAKLAALRPDVQVHNLGFSGYGIQQALAMVQHGLLDRLKCQPMAAFFLAIPDHLIRAVRPTNRHVPRYVLVNGHAQAAGRFDDDGPPPPRSVFRRSRALRRWYFPVWDGRVSQADIDLSVAMLTSLQAALPCPLTVIYWDAPTRHATEMLTALKSASLTVTAASELLPGLQSDPTPWHLHAWDAHPNAAAAEAIAQFAARHLRR